MKWRDFLKGYRTYIICAAGVVYALGIHYWRWPNDSEIWAALGFTGAATLRAAIANICRTLVTTTFTDTAPVNPDAPEP